jgi:hypothetical protein
MTAGSVKFSKKDRAAINLRRAYSLNQVEFAIQNLIDLVA